LNFLKRRKDMPDDFIVANVPGSEKVSAAFKEKVIQIAARLQTNPNFLMAVMSFESGASFSPSKKNLAGSGAVGLIQFMPKTAISLGTTTAALSQMSAEEQLDFVERYLTPFKGRMKTIEDAYMAVLLPSAVGKGSAHILFKKGTTAYNQNRGLDINKDGLITVGDAADRVKRLLGNAAAGTREILRKGSQGAEVENLQDELIDLGYLTRAQKLTGAGTFGPQTEAGLRRFQADNHLTPTGTYDANTQQAIRQLNEGVKRESSGDVVRGLQDRLVKVGLMTVAQTTSGLGLFGPQTEAALLAFQRQHGITPSGILTDETYQALLLAAPDATHLIADDNSTSIETVLPNANPIGYTTYNREPGGRDQFGRASTIRAIIHLGEAWNKDHKNVPFAVGDISRRGGGPFPPHASHTDGKNVDLRPLTNNGINEPTNINAANYSHALTRELVVFIRKEFPNITIFFNDPRLLREGLTKRAAGHDNHLHLRFA
jgi:peptidoglycan hydrolase-like protein with peptidoglycan-binding domain